MAVIRHTTAQELIKDAVVLDLGDIAEQGRRMLADAQRQAEEIVSRAKVERERLLAGAREQGFEAGRVEGVRAGTEQGAVQAHADAIVEARARLEPLDQAFAIALDSFVARRNELEQQASQQVIRLALEIASRVVKRQVECDPSIVADQVRDIIRLCMGPGRVTVRIHPADESVLREVLPRLCDGARDPSSVSLESDASLARGSCMIRHAGGGWIDAGVRMQLDRIADAILPLGNSDCGGEVTQS
ncbi:MAG: FliH/SctL family protein [Phycisphaerales bacterium]